MAKEHYDSFGKTEMWYIMDSDANIVIGLKEDLTNLVILNHITSENVETVFNRETLKKGVVFLFLQEKFMPLRQGF